MTNYEIMTYCEGLLHINLHSPLNVWSREFMWQIEKIMSTLSHFLMISKFMRVVTHRLELPTITLHDPSMRWSCEVTWQIRYIIFPFPKTQRHKTNQGADLPWEVSTLKATWTFDRMISVRSRNNLKNLYLHFHKIYDHLTCLGTMDLFCENS